MLPGNAPPSVKSQRGARFQPRDVDQPTGSVVPGGTLPTPHARWPPTNRVSSRGVAAKATIQSAPVWNERESTLAPAAEALAQVDLRRAIPWEI